MVVASERREYLHGLGVSNVVVRKVEALPLVGVWHRGISPSEVALVEIEAPSEMVLSQLQEMRELWWMVLLLLKGEAPSEMGQRVCAGCDVDALVAGE